MASHSAKECPICHEEYDEEECCPRVLPCCHTLCTKCIENLISRNSKTCPFCIRGFQASTSRDVGVNTSLLDLLKLFRESVQLVPCPCKGEVGKHSNRMNDLKRETDEVINKLLDSVQEADVEIDRNLQSNEELENSLIHANEIISELFTENVKRIDYLREQKRRLKSHKILINETRNILRTAKNKLASAGTFMQIAEAADDVESRKTDTEKHLPNFMVHMAEDEKTRLKLEKVVHLTRDPIEKLKNIVKSSGMDDELNFTPDINHMKIQDFIPQVTVDTDFEKEVPPNSSENILIKEESLEFEETSEVMESKDKTKPSMPEYLYIKEESSKPDEMEEEEVSHPQMEGDAAHPSSFGTQTPLLHPPPEKRAKRHRLSGDDIRQELDLFQDLVNDSDSDLESEGDDFVAETEVDDSSEDDEVVRLARSGRSVMRSRAENRDEWQNGDNFIPTDYVFDDENSGITNECDIKENSDE